MSHVERSKEELAKLLTLTRALSGENDAVAAVVNPPLGLMESIALTPLPVYIQSTENIEAGSNGVGNVYGSIYIAQADVTVSHLGCYVAQASMSGDVQMAIYDSSGIRIGITSTAVPSTSGLLSLPISGGEVSITVGTFVYLALWSDANGMTAGSFNGVYTGTGTTLSWRGPNTDLIADVSGFFSNKTATSVYVTPLNDGVTP